MSDDDRLVNFADERFLNENIKREEIKKNLETEEYIKHISYDNDLTFKELFTNLNLLNDDFLDSLVECRNEDEDINILLRISKNNLKKFIIYDENGNNVGNKKTYYNIDEEQKAVHEQVSNIKIIVFKKKVWSDNYDRAQKAQEARQGGGKRKAKSKKNNVSKKPIVSQKKQSDYKDILGKRMKIYKMPDSRKEYVKYKGELHHITHYKNLMKQKATPKAAAKSKK